MKKLYTQILITIIFLVGLFILPEKVLSQCSINNWNYRYSTSTSYPSYTWNSLTISNGQYFQYYLYSGYIHQIRTCQSNWDSQLTLYGSTTTTGSTAGYLEYNDDCAVGSCHPNNYHSVMAYTSTSSQTGFVQLNKLSCNSDKSSSTAVFYRYINKNAYINGGDITVCSGTEVTLSSSFASYDDEYLDIQWGTTSGGTNVSADAPSVTVSPTTTTTYYMRGKVRGCGTKNGDQYTDIASTTITVSPAPDVSVSGGGAHCNSASLTATTTTSLSNPLEIGNGTYGSSAYPLYGSYNYSRSTSLIRRDEVGNPGTITHLAVYVTTAGSIGYTDIQIRLKKTTETTAPTTFPGDGQLVYSGNYIFNTIGWHELDITDFNWDSDNLLIEWQAYRSSTSDYPSFRYTSVSPDNLQSYSYNNSNYPTTGYVTTIRPDYRLRFSSAPTAAVYWQGTAPNGTSTSDYTNSYTVTNSGTYYFRARSAYPLSCWGTPSSATVTIKTESTAPSSINAVINP